MKSKIELSKRIWSFHRESPFLTRLTQSLRPFICPFEDIINSERISGSVLDVGCGNGTFAYLLKEYNSEVSHIEGYDINPSAVENGNRAFFLSGSSEKTLTCGDFLNCSKKFDTITMIDVLHHIPVEQQDDFLYSAFSKLKVGGVFIYKDLNHQISIYSLWNRIHDALIARELINYKNIDDVLNIFSSQMCSDIKRKKMLLYHHECIIIEKTHD